MRGQATTGEGVGGSRGRPGAPPLWADVGPCRGRRGRCQVSRPPRRRRVGPYRPANFASGRENKGSGPEAPLPRPPPLALVSPPPAARPLLPPRRRSPRSHLARGARSDCLAGPPTFYRVRREGDAGGATTRPYAGVRGWRTRAGAGLGVGAGAAAGAPCDTRRSPGPRRAAARLDWLSGYRHVARRRGAAGGRGETGAEDDGDDNDDDGRGSLPLTFAGPGPPTPASVPFPLVPPSPALPAWAPLAAPGLPPGARPPWDA